MARAVPRTSRDARLSGPASTFLAQSSQGLQLVRVQPIVDPERAGTAHRRDRRRSAAAADRRRASPGSEFALETSIVPVALRLQFEGAADAGPDAFVIRSPTKRAAARRSSCPTRTCRPRGCGFAIACYAAELALAALLVLLLAGPLLDWRRLTRSIAAATILTIAIAADLIAARAHRVDRDSQGRPRRFLAAAVGAVDAVRAADVRVADRFPAERAGHCRPGRAGGVELFDVAVGPSSRHRRGGRRSAVDARRCSTPSSWLPGSAVTALVHGLRVVPAHACVADAGRDRAVLARPDRLVSRCRSSSGLIALNAAVVGLAILLYRLAWSPWVFPIGTAAVARCARSSSWLLAGGRVLRRVCGERSRAAVAVAAGRAPAPRLRRG